MRKAKKTTARKKKPAKKAKRPATRPGAKLWTRAEVAQLRKLYRKFTNPEIAKKLKRTVASVAAKAGSLGLKKPVVRKAKPKRKTTAKRKAAPKRKTAAKRKPAAKKKVAPKRKTTAKKKTAKKKTARKTTKRRR